MRLQLLRRLKAVRRRLQWIEFLRGSLIFMGAAALYLALLTLAGRLAPLPVGLADALPWAATACLAGLAVWLWRGRVRLFDAAVRADESLGLKERLSTALLLRAPAGAPEMAVLEDALQHAERIRPAQSFQAKLDREARWAFGPLAALLLVYFLMPQMNIFAKGAEDEHGHNHAIKIAAQKQAVEKLDGLAKQAADMEAPVKAPLVQKMDKELDLMVKQIADLKMDQEQALAKMAEMKDKALARREEIEKKLAKPASLHQKGEGKLTAEAQKAMQKGDFEKAAKLLDELKEKLKDDKLTAQEKASLAQEMKQMAEQLGKDSPLGQSLEKAASKMQEGKFNEAMADMQMAAMDLKDLEALMAEMKDLDKLGYDMDAKLAALKGKPGICEACNNPGLTFEGLCKACMMATGKWKEGDSRKQGMGMGGPGIGQGAIADKKEGLVGFQKSRIQGQIKPGQVIAKMKVPGEQTPGEVTAEYESVRIDYAQKAEDAVGKESMPLEYKALVRDYFTAIKAPDAAKAAPAAAVVSPAKD